MCENKTVWTLGFSIIIYGRRAMKKLYHLFVWAVLTALFNVNSAQADITFNNSLHIDSGWHTHNTPSTLKSASEFKIAGVYWLPDYLDKNLDFTNRSQGDDDKPKPISKDCEKLGYFAPQYPKNYQCTYFLAANNTHCYKNCKCQPDFIYDSTNCYSGAIIGNSYCDGKANSCTCPSGYSTSVTSCPSDYTYSSSGIVDGKKCGKCTGKPCSAGGYSTYRNDDVCSLVTYGGNSCYSCRPYTCSEQGYSSGKNGDVCTPVSTSAGTCYSCRSYSCSEKCSGYTYNDTCQPGQTKSTCSGCPSYVKCSGTPTPEVPDVNVCTIAGYCTSANGPAKGLKLCNGAGVGNGTSCCGQTYHQSCLAEETCTYSYDYPDGLFDGYYWTDHCINLAGKHKGEQKSCYYKCTTDKYKYVNSDELFYTFCSTSNLSGDICSCGGQTYASACSDTCTYKYSYPDGLFSGYYWTAHCTNSVGEQRGDQKACDSSGAPCYNHKYSPKNLGSNYCPEANLTGDICRCGGVVYGTGCQETCTYKYDYPDGYSVRGYYWEDHCTTLSGQEKGNPKSCTSAGAPCQGYKYGDNNVADIKCSYAVGGDKCECGGATFGTKCLAPCDKKNTSCPAGQSLVNTCEDINGIIWGDCQ